VTLWSVSESCADRRPVSARKARASSGTPEGVGSGITNETSVDPRVEVNVTSKVQTPSRLTGTRPSKMPAWVDAKTESKRRRPPMNPAI